MRDRDELLDYENTEQMIVNRHMESRVKEAFLEYSMSVIVSRALPDVRDGMKPGQRRVLYAMYEDNLTSDKPFRKSATTVGNVLGRYHPHGDQSVYGTLVRMAQPFSLRYVLVDGHGNFGNVDGDGAAAYRYTEARMSKLANELMSDIEKDVVDLVPNFDNTRKELRDRQYWNCTKRRSAGRVERLYRRQLVFAYFESRNSYKCNCRNGRK